MNNLTQEQFNNKFKSLGVRGYVIPLIQLYKDFSLNNPNISFSEFQEVMKTQGAKICHYIEISKIFDHLAFNTQLEIKQGYCITETDEQLYLEIKVPGN